MADVAFSISYDGPALSSGAMPLADLAPALVALNEVFAESALLLYPDNEPISLEARPRPGSFSLDLVLHGAGLGWDQITAFSNQAAALLVLKQLVLGGGPDISLFALIRRIRRRRIHSERSLDGDRVLLVLDGDEEIEVPTQLLRLYQSPRLQRQARDVLSPLHRPGVDRFEAISAGESTLTIDSSELADFELPPADGGLLSDEVTDLHLEVLSPEFDPDHKWRLGHDGRTFSAAVLDPAFLAEIEARHLSFTSGDLLHCRLRTIRTEDADGVIRTERRILSVFGHVKAPQQPTLPPRAPRPDDDDRTPPALPRPG